MNLKIKKIGFVKNVIKNALTDVSGQKNKIVIKKINLFIDH
jgi:hypothetical protein